MKMFELKVPPVLVFAAFGVFMWFLSSITPQIDILGVGRVVIVPIPAFAGLVVGLAGVRAFRNVGTTVHPMDPDRATSLVTTGIYGFTRNPMYLGLLCGLISWALYLSAPWSLAGCFLFVAYMNRFQIVPEERAMHGLFGDDFHRYCNRVRRWI